MNRRQFLGRSASGLGAALATRLQWLLPEAQTVTQAQRQSSRLSPQSMLFDEVVSGERFGGFVLLPPETPIPPDVQPYERGFPQACGVSEPGTEEMAGKLRTIDIGLSDAAALAAEGGFPLYALGLPLPFGLRASGASLIKQGDGEAFGGWVTYALLDSIPSPKHGGE